MHVEVYDNVLPLDMLEAIEHFSTTAFDRGSGTVVVPTNQLSEGVDESELSQIMAAVRRCLFMDGPVEGYVEVWGRHHADLIPFHVDCNEALLTKDHVLQTPERGHILYLADHHPAPTLLFDHGEKALVVVPPRRNRLVRFPGDLLHMVKPLPGVVERRRSVLLFNHWPTIHEYFEASQVPVPWSAHKPVFPDLRPVPIQAVQAPQGTTPTRSVHTFPAMYKDRYATNARLPRSTVSMALWYVDDLEGALLSTKRRMPWCVPAERLDDREPLPKKNIPETSI